MKKLRFCFLRIFLILFILILFMMTAASAQQSSDGNYDIGQLMEKAEQKYDLSREDAVFLLHSQSVNWLPDQRWQLQVHQIVWINSELGVEFYADRRIPFDSEHCELKVETIRTWRGEQWWVTGESGIVETLPFELDAAYDYTNLRETMLLHDGVEVPCIMEIAYTIEDKTPFRPGIEGKWDLAWHDPIVQSVFRLGGSKDDTFTIDDQTGVNPNIVEVPNGLVVKEWVLENVLPHPRPQTDETAWSIPHVLYSTWSDWSGLANDLLKTLETAMEIEPEVIAEIDTLLFWARTWPESLQVIGDFVTENTRYIDYPDYYWYWFPRTADRVLDSGYGHSFDRLILGGALVEQIMPGRTIEPVFKGSARPSAKPTDIPVLAICPDIYLKVGESYLDPTIGNVESARSVENKSLTFNLKTGKVSKPTMDNNEIIQVDIRFDLSYDLELAGFRGSALLSWAGSQTPLAQMLGLKNQAQDFVESFLKRIVPNAVLKTVNPQQMTTDHVLVGLEFELKDDLKDDRDRLTIKFQDCLDDYLPDHVDVSDPTRESAVILPGVLPTAITALKVMTRVNVDLKGLELIYAPPENQIENTCGSFIVNHEISRDILSVQRSLTLAKEHQPEDWASLRELLLAEKRARNQQILLRVKDAQNSIE